jgi:RNA polymerase sigma-70 factor (ECF subfamily)
MQDTALKAWEKRASLRNPQYFRTWITRILIHTCYDARRKRGQTVSLEAIPEPVVAPPDPALDLALQSLPTSCACRWCLLSEGMTTRKPRGRYACPSPGAGANPPRQGH